MRVCTLREQLPAFDRTQASLQEQKLKLAQEREIAAEHACTGALTRILSAYADLLDVFEHDGIALSTMRDDDPPGFDHLLRDLELTQTDIFNLIIPGPGPDGTTSDYRYILVEKQAAIKHWLATPAKK